MSVEPSNNPKWLKKLVRARMKETGQKYTAAMRDIQAEQKETENAAGK